MGRTEPAPVRTFDRENRLRATEISAGQVYRTSGGERVEIREDDLRGKKPLLVYYPEREQGRREARMSRYSFADAASFDGYELLTEPDLEQEIDPEENHIDGTFHGPVPCPLCNAFMSTGYDPSGFPAANCHRGGCRGYYDDVELRKNGYWTEN